MSLNESMVEDAALDWFGELGYAVGHGPHLAPGEPAEERDSFGEVVLVERLREATRRLNPAIPEEASACASHADRRATIRQYRSSNREEDKPMSKKKPTPGGRAKKKAEVSLVRSSAAEYLTDLPPWQASLCAE